MSAFAPAVGFQQEQVLARFFATAAVPSTGFPLAGGGAVTIAGSTRTVAGFATIIGFFMTDVSGTLFVEQSVDGATWDISERIQVTANIPAYIDVGVVGSMARLRYVNGAAPQTIFRMNCVALPIGSGGDSGEPGSDTETGIVIADTAALLGGLATFTGGTFNVAPNNAGSRFAGYDIVRGMAFSDVAGTVTIFQGQTEADVTAGTNVTQTSFAVPAGGNGLQFTNVLVAPYVAIRFVNGAVAQAQMRFWAAVTSG